MIVSFALMLFNNQSTSIVEYRCEIPAMFRAYL